MAATDDTHITKDHPERIACASTNVSMLILTSSIKELPVAHSSASALALFPKITCT